MIYQTLKDYNPKGVRDNAPFLCNDERAWLGDGYYFWDGFRELADEWGMKMHGGKYIVCRAECEFDPRYCLDLHSSVPDMQLVRSLYEMLSKEGLVDDDFTLNELLQYMRNNGLFHYRAARVNGIMSMSKEKYTKYSFTKIITESGKISFVDLMPPIQICFYEKDCMGLKNLSIVFPEKYVEPAA